MFSKIYTLMLLGVLFTVMAAGNADVAGPIVNPWISTDRSVNTFSAATIAADMRRDAAGPMDRAVNFFRFYCRAIFPCSNRNEYPFPKNDQSHMFDFVRMVNVYGYSLCTQGNWMFASFLKQTGLTDDARGISVPGHGTAEAFWGDKWHFMDAVVGCFVYTDKQHTDIASIDQLNADSTLLSRAAAEGRASMPFCPWDGEAIYPEEALTVPDQWYTYRKYALGFLLGALPEYKPVGVAEEASHTMAFSLRPGFRLERMWDNLPGMYNLSYEYHRNNLKIQSPSPALLPPHHPDGGKGRRDENNWPIMKPYRKTINGRDSYRYYANGRLIYEDDFTSRRILDAADSMMGLRLAGGCSALENTEPTGEAVFTLELPYVFVGGAVSGRVELVDGGWVAVYMDLGEAEQWATLGVIEHSGDFAFNVPANLLDERYRFRVKIKLHGAQGPGTALLHSLKVEGVCQLNMYALPFLAPGENRVTVSAAELPPGTALKVTYRWNENGWDREHVHIMSGVAESYRIDVTGSEYPRMKAVVMETVANRKAAK